jgi:hypothetical protein
LTASQLRDDLCDGVNHFIRFRGIHFVRLAWRSGILREEIVDQLYHHAVKAGAFPVILGFCPTRKPQTPLYADDRNFYKVEIWLNDERHVTAMLYAGSSLRSASASALDKWPK